MSWVIAAIIAPIPLFHLWLHALLPFWRKHPFFIYFLGLLVWIDTFFFFSFLNLRSEYLFVSRRELEIIGYFLMLVGLAGIISSIVTLGIKRFFVWAVLRPHSVPAIRISKGPFSFIPHPAYIGYLLIAGGNFLVRGQFYLLYVFVLLCILTPIVIVLEEEELKKRIQG